MAITKNDEKRITARVYAHLSLIFAVLLLGAAGVLWVAGNFAKEQVKSQLAEQKVYFPAKGSPGLDPKEFPDLQQYAGQLVDDGPKAQAYANGFIGRHLQKVAGGKTYSEVSTLAMKDPTNTKLAAQKATLFQGETLRGLLLGDGYGYWTIGTLAQYTAAASAAAGVCLLLVAGWQTRRYKQV